MAKDLLVQLASMGIKPTDNLNKYPDLQLIYLDHLLVAEKKIQKSSRSTYLRCSVQRTISSS